MKSILTTQQPLFQLSWEDKSPFYATSLSAGFDIVCSKPVSLEPGQRVLTPTGLRILWNQPPIKMNLSDNNQIILVPELQIRPRSGLALKYGLTLLNSPCTIDADYRGEIQLILINHGENTCDLNAGERVAQAICSFVIQLPQLEKKYVTRGVGGFGSTGV